MLRMYDFKCKKCGDVMERIVVMGDCPKSLCCGAPTEKMPPVVRVNMGVGPYGYYDENLDAHIGTNRQRRELMRQQGVTEKGGTPKPDGDAWV